MSKVTLLRFALGMLAGLCAFGTAEAQTWRTMTSARQASSSEPMTVEIDYGAGELAIAPAAEGMLYQVEVRYDADNFEPRIEYDEDDRELDVGIESQEGHNRHFDIREGARATISLARDVPLDLDVDFGAGEARIELGDMSLRNVSLSTGASDTEVTFDRPNRIVAENIQIQAGAADLRVSGLGNTRARNVEFEGGVGGTVLDFSGASSTMTASVDMGVGSLTLRLPRGLGVRINRDSFLSSFDSEGLTRRGESYYSANWDRAANQLVIDVSAALGAVNVEWVE